MLISLTTEDQRALVHRLRERSEQWLAFRGLDQFQRGPRARQAHLDIDRVFDQGAFYGWEIEEEVVSVAALVAPDSDFWTYDEMNDRDASYLGRFMARYHGDGHGAALLEALVDQERAEGRERMRLDCWKTNGGLHNYYRRRGFALRRIAEVPGRWSGALFERSLTSVVLAVVIGRAGLLVGRRCDGFPPWTLIGGKVEPGERPQDAVVREVREESGLEITAGRELGRRVHPTTNRMLVYMECRSVRPEDEDSVSVGDPTEVSDLRWIGCDRIDEYMPDLYGPVSTFVANALVPRCAHGGVVHE